MRLPVVGPLRQDEVSPEFHLVPDLVQLVLNRCVLLQLSDQVLHDRLDPRREKAPPHVLLSGRQTFVLASAPNGPADVLVGLSDGDFLGAVDLADLLLDHPRGSLLSPPCCELAVPPRLLEDVLLAPLLAQSRPRPAQVSPCPRLQVDHHRQVDGEVEARRWLRRPCCLTKGSRRGRGCRGGCLRGRCGRGCVGSFKPHPDVVELRDCRLGHLCERRAIAPHRRSHPPRLHVSVDRSRKPWICRHAVGARHQHRVHVALHHLRLRREG